MSFTQYRRRSTALTLLPLLALALGALSMVGNAADAARQKSRFYVGTYTDHGSKGIYAYSFDSATGASTSQGLAAESAQPSFSCDCHKWSISLCSQRDFRNSTGSLRAR